MSLGLTDQVLITLVVSWALLTIVRFVDVNEREPVWALLVAFVFGGAVAGLAHALTTGPDLAMQQWRQAVVIESAKFVALVATSAVFAGVARLKGWSELSDVTDGIVFGIAVGLGYSACETMIEEFSSLNHATQFLLQDARGAMLYSVLGGLSHGVFSAVTGFSFGAAAGARSMVRRLGFPLIGLAGAIVLNALFFQLKHGDALGGTAGLTRAWMAVIIPLLLLVAAGVFSLTLERRIIQRQLAAEMAAGVLNADDVSLLDSFWRRQIRYVQLLLRGRVAECMTIAGRHGRLVQLALLKRRQERQAGTLAGDAARIHVTALRESLLRGRAISLCLFALAAATIAVAPWESVRAQLPGSPKQRWPVTDSLVSVAKKDIDGFWRRQLGTLYSPPAYVGPYITTANCRFEKNNAVYCHSDRSIYYDPQLLDVQNHTIGDYAAVWIVAHEWGHRVQHLQGKLDPSAGMFSIQKELQADCYAGLYTRDAELRNVAQPGDDELAVTSLRGAHDPLDFPWFENGAHGTTGQRIDALEEGFHGRECDGDAFWRRVHVDPRSAPATAPPATGPVFTSVACRRGRFGRIELSQSPQLIHGEITDAIKTKFRSQDGVIVDLTLLAFRSADAAERAEAAASVAGYVVQKEGPVKEGETLLGKWKLLTGKTEIIVSQSRQTIEIAEAAQGIAWEFMTSPAGAPCKP